MPIHSNSQCYGKMDIVMNKGPAFNKFRFNTLNIHDFYKNTKKRA
jgi:hypothetical protein